MFRIRDFSCFSRVSVKALRHYDRLGLLPPAFVDPATRYRYYAARQLTRLNRVLALRDLGFPLQRIVDLLGRDPSASMLRRMLETRRTEVERELEEDRARLARLDAALRELVGPDGGPALDIVLRSQPAVRVASARRHVTDLDGDVEDLFEGLEQRVSSRRGRAAGPPILIYHDRGHRDQGADVEVCVPVLAPMRSARGLPVRTLPAISRAACVAYTGAYDAMTRVLRGLLEWLEANRLTVSGPMREVYLQFGARDPARLGLPPRFLAGSRGEFLTEIQVPVGARRGRQSQSGISRVRPASASA